MPDDSNRGAESASPADPKQRKDLQGWTPSLSDAARIREALERAFDYRGDVRITLNSGETLEGFVYDRRADSASLEQCVVRIIPREGNDRIVVRYCDIAQLDFSGRDTAAGHRFERWRREYFSRREGAGERTDIDSDSEI
jgi:hypothetical protein